MIKEYLFGFPVVKQTINDNLYDKNKIIEDILHNYNLNPNRNEWDNISNIHHSLYDNENKEFIEINYSKLIPIYQEKIINFLNQIYLKGPVNFSFTISNYTCIKDNHYMREHIHPHCDFTGVHYLKFNKKEHYPTSFTNTHNHAKFSTNLFTSLAEKLDMTKTANSWFSEIFSINTEENDFVITPSIVEHSIPFHAKCETHRITIALNISIEN